MIFVIICTTLSHLKRPGPYKTVGVLTHWDKRTDICAIDPICINLSQLIYRHYRIYCYRKGSVPIELADMEVSLNAIYCIMKIRLQIISFDIFAIRMLLISFIALVAIWIPHLLLFFVEIDSRNGVRLLTTIFHNPLY